MMAGTAKYLLRVTDHAVALEAPPNLEFPSRLQNCLVEPAVEISLKNNQADILPPNSTIALTPHGAAAFRITVFNTLRATIFPARCYAEGCMHGDLDNWPADRLRDLVILPVIEMTLLARLAFSLHAAAVLAGGELTLFLGRPGGGKSTMARQWQERFGGELFSDDRVFWSGGKYYSWPENRPASPGILKRVIAVNYQPRTPATDVTELNVTARGQALLAATRFSGQRFSSLGVARQHVKRLMETLFGLLPGVEFFSVTLGTDRDSNWNAIETGLAPGKKMY